MDVDVVSLVHSAEEARGAAHLRTIANSVEIARVPRLSNAVRAVLALPGPVPMTHVLLGTREVHQILERTVRKQRPDVVLAYCSGMAWHALRPPLADIPFVLDIVDADSAKWAALGKTADWPMRLIYRREADRLLRFEVEATGRAFATTVINDREKLVIQGLIPGARIETVSNGIDVEAFRPRQAPGASVNIVFSGVFDYEPNEQGAVWLAQKVWPIVRQRRPDAVLSLVGMNPTRRVRQLASAGSVDVTGAVADVRPFLWNAAAAAAPLFIARGLQNKVLEAVAAGLPSIVTPDVMEGLPLTVREACTCAATAADFAGALLDALNTSPADRRAKASRARLEDWGWETQLAPMEALLRAACSRR